jgi:hypothetical protein
MYSAASRYDAALFHRKSHIGNLCRKIHSFSFVANKPSKSYQVNNDFTRDTERINRINSFIFLDRLILAGACPSTGSSAANHGYSAE